MALGWQSVKRRCWSGSVSEPGIVRRSDVAVARVLSPRVAAPASRLPAGVPRERRSTMPGSPWSWWRPTPRGVEDAPDSAPYLRQAMRVLSDQGVPTDGAVDRSRRL